MDDIVLLQQRLDKHLSEYEMNRNIDEARWEKILLAQEVNTREIAQLTDEVSNLTDATGSLVTAWQTTTGLGSFARWLGGFAVIAAAIQWIGNHMK